MSAVLARLASPGACAKGVGKYRRLLKLHKFSRNVVRAYVNEPVVKGHLPCRDTFCGIYRGVP